MTAAEILGAGARAARAHSGRGAEARSAIDQGVEDILVVAPGPWPLALATYADNRLAQGLGFRV